jgi:hypothetical protein
MIRKMRTDFSRSIWLQFSNQRIENVLPNPSGLSHWHKVSNMLGNSIETIFGDSAIKNTLLKHLLAK